MTSHPGEMLLKLTGSSCSGKTTLAYSVGERLGRLAEHDFDELGVPDGADRETPRTSVGLGDHTCRAGIRSAVC